MTMDFKEPKRFPTDLKFILKWNHVYNHPKQIMREGQQVFLHHNCTHFNCFITSNKDYLIDLRYFDALLFDEENELEEHPPLRTPNQKYVFTASETAKFYPVCNAANENYFNLTWTYRLDSDIPRPFITIFDKNGLEVGPKINMTWAAPKKSIPKDVFEKITKKHKAVAWFKSYCASRKDDTVEEFVRNLNASLVKQKFKLDIYGWCGNKKCPRGRIEECLALLRKDYYFYLAFENSVSEDYVTDKILYPLQNYAVPIVYGGADYSRFLPPGSYIDAGKLEADEVVFSIKDAINHKEVYSEYFRWHNHYTYKETLQDAGLCTLCELLNDPQHNFTKVTNFRKWWNRQYYSKCEGAV
nr:alpha-(1,3)-fucosyltransferase C-like [Maniola hyperantus]